MSIGIRRATVDDIAAIVHHREAMFADMGVGTATGRAQMSEKMRVWLKTRLANDYYLGWMATDGDVVIGGAGMLLLDWTPGPDGIQIPQAHVLNVYVEPHYRRQGIARQLMQTVLAYCEHAGIQTVTLHASDAGRPLYESLGFERSKQLVLRLDDRGIASKNFHHQDTKNTKK